MGTLYMSGHFTVLLTHKKKEARRSGAVLFYVRPLERRHCISHPHVRTYVTGCDYFQPLMTFSLSNWVAVQFFLSLKRSVAAASKCYSASRGTGLWSSSREFPWRFAGGTSVRGVRQSVVSNHLLVRSCSCSCRAYSNLSTYTQCKWCSRLLIRTASELTFHTLSCSIRDS